MRKVFIILSIVLATNCFGQAIVKGLYVDKFNQILGNIQKEDSLLNYAVNKGFNYLALYDLWTIHTTSSLTNTTTALPLADFLNKARTIFSISNIGATGENYWFFSNVIHVYNQQHSNPNHKLNVYNLEFEFWTTSFVNTGGIYCTSYLQPGGYSCDTSGGFKFYIRELRRIDSLGNTAGITSETYIGWPNSGQARAIVRNCDRVLVHAYVSNESTTYNYTRNRLIDLSGATTTAKIMPIFSAEPVFMGPWVSANSPLQAYTNYNINFVAETGAWKSNVSVLGYQWFAYSYMPKSLTSSIKELQKEHKFTVLPNPSYGILNVNADFTGKLRLVDLLGREVISFNVEENKIFQVNISGLSDGIYYLIAPEYNYAEKIVMMNR